MKRYILAICLIAVYLQAFGGISLSDIKIERIDKSVRELGVDSINLSSPLNFYLSRAWVRLTGKERYWATISSIKFGNNPDAPDEDVSDDVKEYVLNDKINFIATYKDSVAAIITQDSPDFYLITNCWIENGRWVNGGQTFADGKMEMEDKVIVELENNLANLPRIPMIANTPTSVEPFVEYISTITTSPEAYLLDKLGKHRVVINGEYHRRKVSWDMLKRLIAHPDFANVCGTIFMELPSWKQNTMNTFLSSDTLCVERIYEILREEQPLGWPDRGEMEFLCELYKLNKLLSADKRIRVILADYQVPYSELRRAEDARETEDRNTHMAEVISDYVMSSLDSRNCLFLVGCAHVYKSEANGIASTPRGMKAARTAGAQLSQKFGINNVFTVFQHVLPGDNSGRNKAPIRGGIFDAAFEANDNRAIGFDLAESPFGNEPFDGIHEIKWLSVTGTYSDNYDGYLFLHKLEDEPKNTNLIELYTPQFVEEIKRRAKILGWERLIPRMFGCAIEELTPAHFSDN